MDIEQQVTDINNQNPYWDSVAWEKTFTHPLNIDVFRDHVFRLPEGTILRHHSVEWIEALTARFRVIHLSEDDGKHNE